MIERVLRELRWIEAYFLFRYQSESYLIRQKARILFWSMVTASFLFSISLALNLNNDPPNYLQAKLNGLLIFIFISSLLCLRRGNYHRTVFLIYLFIFIIWGFGYYEKLNNYWYTGINSYHYHLFSLIAFSIFFGNRRWLIISAIILGAINTIVMVIAYEKHTDIIFNTVYKGIHVNIFISLIISGVLLYLFSEVAERSLKKTARELRKNRMLNSQLEKKVEEKTRKIKENLDEITIMNENLQEVNRSLKNAQTTILNDINMAANVQKSFLYDKPPQVKNWDIALEFLPMSRVSGDFYDFYLDDDKLIGFSLFDVSGHGVSSALITMVAKSIIFHNFQEYHDHEPGTILQKSNEQIKEEIGKAGHHLTGVLLQIKDNAIQYANAGHVDIYIARKDGKIYPAQQAHGKLNGTFLGLMGIDPKYNSIKFEMEPNEVLVAFTDGLVEANHDQDYNIGINQLVRYLEAMDYYNMSASEIRKELALNFYKFIQKEKIRDDITVIILKRL